MTSPLISGSMAVNIWRTYPEVENSRIRFDWCSKTAHLLLSFPDAEERDLRSYVLFRSRPRSRSVSKWTAFADWLIQNDPEYGTCTPRKIPALSLPTDPVVTVQNEVMSKERRWKMYLRAVSLYDVFSTVPPTNNQCQYSSFRGVCESLRERQGLWAAQ
jgi:hypothetical protein